MYSDEEEWLCFLSNEQKGVIRQGGATVNKWEIAVIPGDGIGKEVVPAALDVLKTVADVHGQRQIPVDV